MKRGVIMGWVLVVFSTISALAQNDNVSVSEITGCWMASSEEKTDSQVNVYRRCDYKKFPPSRFRFKMELLSDNQCTWLQLSPNDKHETIKGTWAFDTELGLIETFDLEGNKTYRFSVVDVNKNQLEAINLKLSKWRSTDASLRSYN